jgi:hypothetical protein
MPQSVFALRAFVLLGGVVCALASFPAHGDSDERHASSACATGSSTDSSSSAAAASASSRSAHAHSDAYSDAHKDVRNSRQTDATNGTMSSSVTSGPGGLSGTTTMPDGSTVTIAPGQANASSSVVTSGSSHGSSASASGAGTKDDACIDEVPSDSTSRAQQNGKHLKSQKENRR